LYRYLQPKVGGWVEVTPKLLADYKVYLSKNPGKARFALIAETTQIQHWACIKSFFGYLNKIGGMSNDSADIVFADLKLREELEPDYLTPEELNILWGVCGDNILHLAVVSILFFTGLRHSELLSCSCSSVSFENSEIRVRGKGGRWRTVFLTPECLEILNKYMDWRNSVALGDDNALFISERGEGLTYNQLSYIFTKLKKHISRIHPHLLRHTFATYLLQTGSTIREVQEQLGHKRISTTGRYLHVTEEAKVKHKRLSKYMRQKR